MTRQWKRMSGSQLQQMWELWKAGQTLQMMSDALTVRVETVYAAVVRAGGIAPPARRRSERTLSVGEREEISRSLVRGSSVRAMARQLGRAPSTISREIRRHGGMVRYRAAEADRRAWQRARRPKRCVLARNGRLRRLVASKLRADWSPQQIAAWCVKTYPTDATMQVSHETIYRTLYVQARGALKRELLQHLRRQRTIRRSGPRSRVGHGQGQIVDAVPISARPARIEDRALPGHWDAASVAKALIRRVRHLPRGLMQSLTWDRGSEMARHKQFTMATDAQVYFCDPRSPWQRGSNENTNGLLRQYFPKGGDLTNVTQRQLDAVALKLNTRPRETLHWKTPAEVLLSTVATTG